METRLRARVAPGERDEAIRVLNEGFGQTDASPSRIESELDIILIVRDMGHGGYKETNVALREQVRNVLAAERIAVVFPEFEEDDGDPPPTRL